MVCSLIPSSQLCPLCSYSRQARYLGQSQSTLFQFEGEAQGTAPRWDVRPIWTPWGMSCQWYGGQLRSDSHIRGSGTNVIRISRCSPQQSSWVTWLDWTSRIWLRSPRLSLLSASHTRLYMSHIKPKDPQFCEVDSGSREWVCASGRLSMLPGHWVVTECKLGNGRLETIWG